MVIGRLAWLQVTIRFTILVARPFATLDGITVISETGTSTSLSELATNTSPAPANKSGRGNAGVIAGSVVGGSVALASIGLGFWFLACRKRKSRVFNAESPHSDPALLVEPFTSQAPNPPIPNREGSIPIKWQYTPQRDLEQPTTVTPPRRDDVRNPENLEDWMRDIQSRMDVMMREMHSMNKYVVPPAYSEGTWLRSKTTDPLNTA
ncbi:hypothetical protein VKT23_013364 [Stygiomarasmius scandens]|uniref:Uncharacterized protein n=1 Tax=Marasmiellus scandens TaxID=2682957 RepID=A0ABR1J8G8_9AGAR